MHTQKKVRDIDHANLETSPLPDCFSCLSHTSLLVLSTICSIIKTPLSHHSPPPTLHVFSTLIFKNHDFESGSQRDEYRVTFTEDSRVPTAYRQEYCKLTCGGETEVALIRVVGKPEENQ